MNASNSPLRIAPVLPADRDAAFGLVFGQLSADQRRLHIAEALAAEASQTTAQGGLWGAYRGGRLVGAVFSTVQPGRSAALWPPQILPTEPQDTAVTLLDHVAKHLADCGIAIVQALLPNAATESEVLKRGGFVHAADLFYLTCQHPAFPALPPPTPLRFETYAPANHERLLEIVEATYVETLDCPMLNGVRSVEDVLAGYRAAGVFDPARWLLVTHAGADVGCLLLMAHPQHAMWELGYMGVVPQARGHGWGRHISRHAQWLAKQAGQLRLVLAVDERNGPALRMYAAVGFEVLDRRSVYLKIHAPQTKLTGI
jgi:ribosomal protein S18 acetylase RimI-like enzyme